MARDPYRGIKTEYVVARWVSGHWEYLTEDLRLWSNLVLAAKIWRIAVRADRESLKHLGAVVKTVNLKEVA